MSLETLNSILYIRFGLRLSGEACYDHELPDDVLQLFGTSAKSTPSAELAIEERNEDRVWAFLACLVDCWTLKGIICSSIDWIDVFNSFSFINISSLVTDRFSLLFSRFGIS